MKKNFVTQIILTSLLALGVLVGDVFYILGSELLVKTIASAGFFLIGLINIFFSFKQNKENINFAMVMTIGLFFAMLGDILLELNFIIGAMFFAIGHVFYFVAYCVLVKFKWIDLVAGGAIATAGILFILLAPIFNIGVVMKIVIIFYAIIISLMLGKAITNLIRQRSVINIVLLVGSFLFFFSDFMLLLCNFTTLAASLTEIFGVLCLASYYPAEIILAMSIFALPKIQEKQTK